MRARGCWWALVGVLVAWSGGGVGRAEQADRSGPRARAMTNCPNAVPGASTEVRDVRNGVLVTVRARGAWAVEQVRRRARIATPAVVGAPLGHTGRGTGGGRIGYCPAVRGYTRISVTNVRGGVRM